MRSPSPARSRLLVALLALLVAAPSARGSAQTPGITVGAPAPSWAEVIDPPPPRAEHVGALEQLLFDQQSQLSPEAQVDFHRVAYRVATTAGLASGSQISIEVSSREELVWHWARRVRDGVATDVLAQDRVRVIQPEARLDDGLYDERRSALLFVEDVRVGDVIDYAYSLREDSSLLGGRNASRIPIGWPGARRVRFAARWPRDRAVRTRLHELPRDYHVVESDGALRVDALDVPLAELADDAPAWIVGAPWVEISEFAAWSDVERWARPLYAIDDLDAVLANVPMDRLRAAGARDAQIEAALQFVQDEVRYLGVEVAHNAIVPHAPAEVARRRYGDCKDKALLLVAILRGLGVQAEPALASTTSGASLDDALPSPYAFDHVVVRIHLDGGPVWVDATRTFERGPLRDRPALTVRRALPIGGPEQTLVEVPLPIAAEPTQIVDERYVVAGAQSSLRATTLYRGPHAARLRSFADARRTESIGESALDFYRELGLDVRVREPLRIEDDARRGTVTVHEHYSLDEFWAVEERGLDAWAVIDHLPVPSESRPPGPLALPHPVHVVHRVSVANDRGWQIQNEHEVVETEELRVSRRVTVRGRELEIEVRLQTLADHVPADRVEVYRERALAADALARYSVIEHAEPSSWSRAIPWIVLGIPVLVVLGVIALGALRRRLGTRRSRAFRRMQSFAGGESAQAAIEVRDRDEAEREHRTARCCGARVEGGQWSQAQLGGARLFVHAATCASCGRAHRRYYRQRDAA
ncbi:DUF3857 domain-containing transglutaminase family protein [Sandaracinus amylolyticus]|uniref:Transglutaminase-like enzyme n=1 Tax=Sandaracinus amylolyticus TaxID=927083 RepID=A0A0F6YFP0_9BACT|nr:DUF3857 domain-containing transglutaminase family protein [Sandaracinus amylolyticus]AKF02903.1 Transglutaminase-like enzyme [Sandaracinus amylolyticus]